MSKKVMVSIMVFVLLGFVSLSAVTAQSQWDITLNTPVFLGMKYQDNFINLRDEAENIGYGDFKQYSFLLPEFRWTYFVELYPKFRIGAGAQLWTVVVQSVIYPSISFEYDTGYIIFQGGVGGGSFFLFGLVNEVVAGDIVLPEISAAFKLGKHLRLGVGSLFIFAPGLSEYLGTESDDFIVVGNVFTRWSF